MTHRYLALGDSYTIGEQVPLEESFPYQVVSLLNAAQSQIHFEAPTIVATTGWTTDELQSGIDASSLAAGYDWVTLLIGVNNQYRNRSVEEYAVEFEALLKRAIAFANNDTNRVVVLSIPDWGVTPFAVEKDPAAIATAIDAYNQVNKSISAAHQVAYIDITPLSRIQGKDAAYLVEDQLHYSGKAYATWAQMLATTMLEKI